VDEPSPPIIIKSKMGRKPLIGGKKIIKDCCIFIGQGQEAHLGRWRGSSKGQKNLGLLFLTLA
jgi:hypothetical protein